jgi:hypothetical protein
MSLIRFDSCALLIISLILQEPGFFQGVIKIKIWSSMLLIPKYYTVIACSGEWRNIGIYNYPIYIGLYRSASLND